MGTALSTCAAVACNDLAAYQPSAHIAGKRNPSRRHGTDAARLDPSGGKLPSRSLLPRDEAADCTHDDARDTGALVLTGGRE